MGSHRYASKPAGRAAVEFVLSLALGVSSIALAGAASAQAPAAGSRLVLRSYGDVLYSHYDYGPDQKSGDHGSPPDDRATVDVAFFVTELKFFFAPELYLEAEVEYEHGGTGSALELEYEEFGEYEVDVEKGGEVKLEEFHLTRSFGRALSLRAGRFITAVGLLNRSHAPTQFFTTVRSESEVSVVPTTWDETGLEVFGEIARIKYRLQLVNGLDSSGFSSKYWVAGGHQKKFEVVRATDLAAVGRIDWETLDGLVVGAAIYYGNTTGNRPKPDMEGIDAHLTIADVHATFDRGPVRGHALYLAGRLENADLISSKNSRLSVNLQAPRTPVATGAFAWSAEMGVDILRVFKRDAATKLYPFVRYEHYDTMAEVGRTVFADPRFDRRVTTAGIDFFPHDDVVIKLDVSHRSFGMDRINTENTVAIDIGFAAELLRL
jgi:hypothetical protein